MTQCVILTGGTWNKPEWAKPQRNIGAYRVATELENNGYSTFVLDYIIELSLLEIETVLSKQLSENTLWVGFSSTFYWFPEHGKTQGNGDILKLKEMYWCEDATILSIVEIIRRLAPNAKIIYGGTKAEFFLGSDSNIDYYILGLADTAIVPLTKAIENKELIEQAEKLPNGSHVVDCRNFPEPKLQQISTRWDLPKFNILPHEPLAIEFARGCIFKCKFCTYPLLGKKKGTYLRDVEQVKQDLLRNYYANGTTVYSITDDTVNDDTDKLRELARVIQELPFQLRLVGFLRLDLINRYKEQAQLLLDMGVCGAFFGIETLNHDSGKSIGKGMHPNKVLDTLDWLYSGPWKDKVNISGGVILGLPHDTLEYFDQLITKVSDPSFPMHHLQMYPLHLNDRRTDARGMYVSEFNLNPEIYGYTFPGKDNYFRWELESQGLTYTLVDRISKEFNAIRSPLNKVSGFEVAKYLALGIPYEDINSLPLTELNNRYNIPMLNKVRLLEYKAKLGVL